MLINLTHVEAELTKDYFYANMHFTNPRVYKKENLNIFPENHFLYSTNAARSRKYPDTY